MKGLNRLAIGVLGLAPMFAAAEIKSLDDSSMGDITGQAGISIELDTKVEIGEFKYVDQGALAVRNITLTGANKTTYFGQSWGAATYSGDRLDNLRIDVDILADGDLVLFMRPKPETGQAVDFKLTTDEWALQKSTGVDGTKLLSDFSMTGLGLDLRIKVDNQTSWTRLEATFAVDDLDANLEFLGVGIQDMSLAGFSYFESLRDWGTVGLPDIGATLKMDIHTTNTANHNNVLALDVVEFKTDIAMPIITLGSAPSIGALNFNDVDIKANMIVYGH